MNGDNGRPGVYTRSRRTAESLFSEAYHPYEKRDEAALGEDFRSIVDVGTPFGGYNYTAPAWGYTTISAESSPMDRVAEEDTPLFYFRQLDARSRNSSLSPTDVTTDITNGIFEFVQRVIQFCAMFGSYATCNYLKEKILATNLVRILSASATSMDGNTTFASGEWAVLAMLAEFDGVGYNYKDIVCDDGSSILSVSIRNGWALVVEHILDRYDLDPFEPSHIRHQVLAQSLAACPSSDIVMRFPVSYTNACAYEKMRNDPNPLLRQPVHRLPLRL